MLRLVRLLFLFLIPLALRAEERVARPTLLKFNLESAIQAALSKNFAIQVQKFEPKIAKEGVTRELGHFDPVFSLSAERSENAQPFLFQNGLHLDSRALTRTDRL